MVIWRLHMTTLPKEHKAKISKALALCDKAMLKVFNDMKTTHPDMYELILKNTVIAGGVFRSHFVGTPVKDIDVFFTNKHSALRFRDYFLQTTWFNKVTTNFSFEYQSLDLPPVSFITNWANEPATLIEKFDFSFNQHYYNLWTGEMRFDVDTFSKKGFTKDTSVNIEGQLRRALKFIRQGIEISDTDIIHLINKVAGKYVDPKEAQLMCQALMKPINSSSGQNSINQPPQYSYQFYTEKDYHGVKDTSNQATQNGLYTTADTGTLRYYEVPAPTPYEWAVTNITAGGGTGRATMYTGAGGGGGIALRAPRVTQAEINAARLQVEEVAARHLTAAQNTVNIGDNVVITAAAAQDPLWEVVDIDYGPEFEDED